MDARRQKICFDIPRIPGIGAKTAFAMFVEMPELGAIEHRDAASLAGLARLARQSGRGTGRAFIRGGQAGYRSQPADARSCRREAAIGSYGSRPMR